MLEKLEVIGVGGRGRYLIGEDSNGVGKKVFGRVEGIEGGIGRVRGWRVGEIVGSLGRIWEWWDSNGVREGDS